MRLVHPLFYAMPRRDSTRGVHFHATRDRDANYEIACALAEQEDFGFGTSILNFPATPRTSYQLLPEADLRHVPLPFVRDHDVIVCTTRPPLSDGMSGDNKCVEPGNTDLERRIFHFWGRYVRKLSRAHLVWTDAAAACLPDEMRNRAEITFFQQGCRYQHLKEPGADGVRIRSPFGQRTLAALLRLDELWPNGPGLVCAWGMNATATLAWCHLVRHRYPHLLHHRGLTAVELDPAPLPAHPTTFEWTLDWRATPLFQTAGELPQ